MSHLASAAVISIVGASIAAISAATNIILILLKARADGTRWSLFSPVVKASLSEDRTFDFKVDSGIGPIIGNGVTHCDPLRLMLKGEPNIIVPEWPLLNDTLRTFANSLTETRERQQELANLPGSAHCSVYILAQVVQQCHTKRPVHVRQPTQWKKRSLASGYLIDLADTYGIKVDFADYWRAIVSTPTKWEVTGDHKILVARSAWGAARIRTTANDKLIFKFTKPLAVELDTELFGRATFVHAEKIPAGAQEYLAEMIWKGTFVDDIRKADCVHITFNSMGVIDETIATLASRLRIDYQEQKHKRPGFGSQWGGQKPHEICETVLRLWAKQHDASCNLRIAILNISSNQILLTPARHIYLQPGPHCSCVTPATIENRRRRKSAPQSLDAKFKTFNTISDWAAMRIDFNDACVVAALEWIARCANFSRRAHLRDLPRLAEGMQPWQHSVGYLV